MAKKGNVVISNLTLNIQKLGDRELILPPPENETCQLYEWQLSSKTSQIYNGFLYISHQVWPGRHKINYIWNQWCFVNPITCLHLIGLYLWSVWATNLIWCNVNCCSAIQNASIPRQQLPQIRLMASPVCRSQLFHVTLQTRVYILLFLHREQLKEEDA